MPLLSLSCLYCHFHDSGLCYSHFHASRLCYCHFHASTVTFMPLLSLSCLYCHFHASTVTFMPLLSLSCLYCHFHASTVTFMPLLSLSCLYCHFHDSGLCYSHFHASRLCYCHFHASRLCYFVIVRLAGHLTFMPIVSTLCCHCSTLLLINCPVGQFLLMGCPSTPECPFLLELPLQLASLLIN